MYLYIILNLMLVKQTIFFNVKIILAEKIAENSNEIVYLLKRVKF